ncbi:hypothetical protein IAG25_15615 [Caballeronia sp. EK]|uniref:hypothetical protein n=1 Tax=Caballeronia sp. EK TaxID=2767469 RepID=UPI00165644BF|nr:hypothetical protein [Caballeronia sp. EK]MBC8638249.1 hypothetical protein [Caballeronia sp. EK]
MDDQDEYLFRIGAFTPGTIPMERLAKYMTSLARLFGNDANVHLDHIEEGSTMPVLKVDVEAASKVSARIADLSRGEAANDARIGFDELNALLRDDNATGELRQRFLGQEMGAVVLRFPGKDLPRPLTFGPFTEPATFDGELVRVGGRDKSAHATIIDPDGRSWHGEISRQLAQDLAPYLYKGPILRVNGDARWERREDGAWHVTSLKINEFSVLDDETLLEVTDRLRKLESSGWSKHDDIDGYITALRGESDGLH